MIKDDTITNNIDPTEEEPCESKIVNTKTMPCCCSKCVPPYAKTFCPFVAKVTVVKKICYININVKSLIKLEKWATDIKEIDKEVCLTQCTLCPIYTPHMGYRCRWAKYQLFLEGYVKKNIRYCHPKCEPECKNSCVSGDILCTTCKIPFECSTTIKLRKTSWKGDAPSFQEKFETLDETRLCRNPYEQHLVNFENFVELPRCELVHSVINECDFVKKPRDDGQFRKLEEKMVVSVTLRILQDEEKCIKPGECGNYYGGGKQKETMEREEYDEYDEFEEYDRDEEFDAPIEKEE